MKIKVKKRINNESVMYLYEQKNPSICPYYSKDEYDSVDYFEFSQEEKRTKKSAQAEIVYLEKGCVKLQDNDSYLQEVCEGELCFLPPGQSRIIHASAGSALTVFRLSGPMRACKLAKKDEEEEINPEGKAYILPVKKELKGFLLDIQTHIGNNALCPRFFILKTEELFLLLNAYYSEAERRKFFYYEENRNSRFFYFIQANYLKVKTVKEFAALSGFSLSAFEKLFRRVFETSPYEWMMQKREEQLREELIHSEKPLKVVSELCGFASPSQMSDFCRKRMGMTPGEIRKNLSLTP